MAPIITDDNFNTKVTIDSENLRINRFSDLEAVKNGDTRFVPKKYETTYFNWLNNIKDWCISRQIWWGHQIPAYY